MRRIALIVLLGGALLAPSCPPINPGLFPTILEPARDAVVADFSFPVELRIPNGSSFDPATDVTINGVPVVVSGGPTDWAAIVGPGGALSDDNQLLVHIVRPDGSEVTSGRQFQYLPPKARLRQITDAADLIEGPLAHGKVGDWLLENSVARFIVQDVNQRDMYSVGAFGGNIIDAELVASPGNDNFLEVQPTVNIETVINAITATPVNDGADGTAAILRVCGPDDLLDFVNPSSFLVDAGLPVPPLIDDNDQDVEGCTEYSLEPLVPYVRMDTNIMNNEAAELALAVGDWMNAAGELDQWGKPSQMGEVLTGVVETLSFVGTGEAQGVDYSLTTIPVDPPQVGAIQSQSFTTSGVTVLLHGDGILGTLFGAPPSFKVPAGGDLTFTRFLTVGDGSGSNGVATELAEKGAATGTIQGCVSVNGTPLAGSRVSVVQRNLAGTVISMDGQFVTRAGACPNYSGALPVDSFEVAAARAGARFESDLPAPTFKPVTIAAGGTASVDFDLPAPGQLEVSVTDESGADLPARVSVVGFDPSPPQVVLQSGLLGDWREGLFQDPKDRVPFGLVAFDYADASGSVRFDVEPGDYAVFVSRGTEYSVFQSAVTITAGAVTPVAAQIGRVLDTSGFVSSDFHVHGIRSADSRISDTRRVLQFGGEGIENPIMTDHHVHTDLTAPIAGLGMSAWMSSTIGEEITTFDYGHFNGYPFTVDPSKPSGGSTDWGQAADPGCDFPLPLDPGCPGPAWNATPGEILALARNSPEATPDTTVQINHIDSHFEPTQIDTSVAGPIMDGLDDTERAQRRLPTVAVAGNLFQPFPALEIWNGADRNQQRNFLEERIGIWMNHLNKGHKTTFIADTDTHTYTDLETAGARTWTASSTDDPSLISSGEVARAVDAGRATGGQGLYVQTRLLARDGSAAIADLTLGGSTQIVSSNGDVDFEIRVQAPTWAEFDRVEIYTNALPSPPPVDPGDPPPSPYLFTATPDQILLEGDCDPATTGDGDFDIPVTNVHTLVPGASRQDVTVTVSYTGLTQDAWFVALAKGSDGTCAPMFPVYPRQLDSGSNTVLADLLDGNVGESGTMALGASNALYVDVDGIPGFNPPNP